MTVHGSLPFLIVLDPLVQDTSAPYGRSSEMFLLPQRRKNNKINEMNQEVELKIFY